MTTTDQHTIILKLGGSVVTYKNRNGLLIRRKALVQIANEINDIVRNDKNIRLIIIHGAGSGGHQLAKKYNLNDGVNGDVDKLYGSLLTRMACQNLDLMITGIFLRNGLMMAPVHTGSIIIQDDKTITNKSFDIIDQAFKFGCIPMMYGEMVFDKKLGMSVCSGDAIAMTLARKYNAEKIIFASDIDGVYDKDPHANKDARLITSATLDSIMSDKKVTLSDSHNIDVTGGLQNKIAVLVGSNAPKSLKTVIVCNGLKPGTISKALTGEKVGTVINI